MKTRLAFLCSAVLAAVVLPQSFQAITAEQLEVTIQFDHLPPMNATPREDLLRPVKPFPNISSTILVGSNNTLCRFNGKTFATSDPVQLFPSPFEGGVNFDGVWTIDPAGGEDLLIVGGPAGPSRNPLSAFLFGPPVERLGPVMEVPGADQFGHQVMFGNLMGDDTLEMAFATNRGGGSITVWEPQTDRSRIFFPFGQPYPDGVQLTAADINGDGHDEMIVYQTRGREFRAFQFRNLSSDPVLVGFGDPFGPFFGGGSVTGFDVNNDGRDELLFAPGPGHAPLIRIIDFEPSGPRLVTQFLAGPDTMTGGTTVQAGLTDGQLTIGAIVRSDPGLTSVQRERIVEFVMDRGSERRTMVYDGNPFGERTALALLLITGQFDQ